jgi:hypothetical protein
LGVLQKAQLGISRKAAGDFYGVFDAARAEKLGRPRIALLGFGRPPEYDREVEPDDEHENVHAFIFIRAQNGAHPGIKYEMLLEAGIWKIDAAFEWHPSSGRWRMVKAL